MTLNWKIIGLVFAGGALGTLLRLGVSFGLDSFTSLATVNVIGSAVLGWLNSDPRFASTGKRAFWAIGFSGGFTTMSSVALLTAGGIVMLASAGASVDFAQVAQFFGLIIAIFAASLLAYWGAHALTARLTGNSAVVSHEVEEVTE
ncbi:MAG: fluoride efflux transporter FluC [Rhodoluna sp.]